MFLYSSTNCLWSSTLYDCVLFLFFVSSRNIEENACLNNDSDDRWVELQQTNNSLNYTYRIRHRSFNQSFNWYKHYKSFAHAQPTRAHKFHLILPFQCCSFISCVWQHFTSCFGFNWYPMGHCHYLAQCLFLFFLVMRLDSYGPFSNIFTYFVFILF